MCSSVERVGDISTTRKPPNTSTISHACRRGVMNLDCRRKHIAKHITSNTGITIEPKQEKLKPNSTNRRMK